MRALTLLLLVALAGAPLSAELPGFYKEVDRLVWVVPDLDETISHLRKLDFTNVRDLGEARLNGVEYRGEPATGSVRLAAGRFGDVPVYWIEPLGGRNVYADFLEEKKGGVLSLVHRAPTAASYDAELARLKGLGVDVLQKGSVETASGTIRYAMLDTLEGGKYSLGLIHFPGGDEGPLAVPPGNPSGRVVSQYAFAVKRLEPVSAYWAKLGFPEMSFTHNELTDKKYHGQSAEFDMRLGWQRHGEVVYEWIQSLQGPDVYLDHMKIHGEGFHHLAFNVEDMDEALADFASRGYPETLSGGWGKKGKPGSGRFAYIDTQPVGGIDVELLWNYR